MEDKKYLDLTGLSHYDEKIKKVIEDGDKASKDYVDGKIGTLGEGVATVAAAIAAEKGLREAEDKAINDAIGTDEAANTIKGRIKTLETATSTDSQSVIDLKATHAKNEDGSLKTVADEADEAVAKIVADAPEAFDTLKEIADWIQKEGEQGFDAAARIVALEEEVGDINDIIGTDTTPNSIKGRIKALEDAEIDTFTVITNDEIDKLFISKTT